MPDHPRLRSLLEWSLAAFHAGFLFASLVALLYAGGGLGQLLGSLNTLSGVALYAAFWLGTWWTTRRAARGLDWSALDRPVALVGRLGRLALWGGINGLLLFAVVFAVIVGNTLLLVMTGNARIVDMTSFAVTVGAVGAVVAFVIGAVAGVLFAVVDGVLLALAGWLVPAEA